MLTHYIFVRRDLPIGVLTAMVVHAAGESAAKYDSNVDDFTGATAVVLEVKDEDHLTDVVNYLEGLDIEFITIRESSPPYTGQLMALGLLPGEKDDIAPHLRTFQTLKSCLDNEKNTV